MPRLLSLLLVTVSILVSGCAMCSTPYDCHYPAYGGRTPRGDRVYGRVGSAFRDAAAVQGTLEEGEFFEGEIIEGEVFEGEVIEGGISDGGYIEDTTNSYVPMESEIIELPQTGEAYSEGIDGAGSDYQIVDPIDQGSPIELPDTINGAVDDLIMPQTTPNSEVVPVAPDLGSPVPLSSPSPSPAPTTNSLPNLDRVFDGLPPARDEAVIELYPAVSGQ